MHEVVVVVAVVCNEIRLNTAKQHTSEARYGRARGDRKFRDRGAAPSRTKKTCTLKTPYKCLKRRDSGDRAFETSSLRPLK